jgi:glycine/D-amino acid oxidase-like deaminating enzyme
MAVHQEFEYIVVGLGGIGSAAAFWMARRAGTGVLVLEQFALGHVRVQGCSAWSSPRAHCSSCKTICRLDAMVSDPSRKHRRRGVRPCMDS